MIKIFERLKKLLFKDQRSSCNEINYMEFTEEDVSNILNTIRPLVKKLNDDNDYLEFCKNTLKIDCKKLKTFYKISEDNKTMSIFFTQNTSFNSDMNDFIIEYVIPIFKIAITSNAIEKCIINTDNGIMSIMKIE